MILHEIIIRSERLKNLIISENLKGPYPLKTGNSRGVEDKKLMCENESNIPIYRSNVSWELTL